MERFIRFYTRFNPKDNMAQGMPMRFVLLLCSVLFFDSVESSQSQQNMKMKEVQKTTELDLEDQARQRWKEQKEKNALVKVERTSQQWRSAEHKKEQHIEHKIEREIEKEAIQKEACKPVPVMHIFFAGLISGVLCTGLALYSDGIVGYGVSEAPSKREARGSYQEISGNKKAAKQSAPNL